MRIKNILLFVLIVYKIHEEWAKSHIGVLKKKPFLAEESPFCFLLFLLRRLFDIQNLLFLVNDGESALESK